VLAGFEIATIPAEVVATVLFLVARQFARIPGMEVASFLMLAVFVTVMTLVEVAVIQMLFETLFVAILMKIAVIQILVETLFVMFLV
jgi:hypothetical protein